MDRYHTPPPANDLEYMMKPSASIWLDLGRLLGSHRQPGILAMAAVLIISSWMLTPSALAQGEARPSYQIAVTINAARATLDVQESVAFTNWTGAPLSSIVLRLPPAEISGVSLTRATATNQAGEATLSNAVLEIPVQPPIQPGDGAGVDVAFSANIPRQAGRLGITSEAITLGNWFATLSVHRGDWDRRPYTEVGDAFFTEVADFQVDVDTVQPMELAFTGTLKQRDGTRWSILAQNVRDVALVGSPRFSVAQSTVGSTQVTAYSLNAPAQRLADSAAEILQWYSGRFGVYPYAELRAVEADLPASYGGMEYPGLVMLSSQYGPLQRGSAYEALLAHELAHQWFYSLVGNDQIEAAWLDEGLATLAPALFYQDVAPSVGRTQIQQIQSAPIRASLDSSLYEFSDDGPYFAAIYRPAARMMLELRDVMGAEAFDAALREYVSIHSHRIATPRALLDLLQRRTASNLNPTISRYVNYGAFDYPTPQLWSPTLSSSTLSGSAQLVLEASFPIGLAEVWLDNQPLVSRDIAGAREANLALDLRGSSAGEHVLQTSIRNDEGAQFEQDIRVTIR